MQIDLNGDIQKTDAFLIGQNEVNIEIINEQSHCSVKYPNKTVVNAIEQEIVHKIPFEEFLNMMGTDRNNGLTKQQASVIKDIFGDNRDTELTTPFLKQFISENKNFYTLLLWLGAIGSVILYGCNQNDTQNIYIGFFIIATVSSINLLIVFFRQHTKELQKQINAVADVTQIYNVIRDSKEQEIRKSDLVIGDLLIIKSGLKMPVDLRIIESESLTFNEVELTGEMYSVSKVEQHQMGNFTEAKNIAFASTVCDQGYGKGIVISTGQQTFISKALAFVSPIKTDSLQLHKLINIYLIIAFIIGVIFFLISFFSFLSVYESISIGIAIFVSNAPISLLVHNQIMINKTIKNLSKKNVLIQNSRAIEKMGDISCLITERSSVLTNNFLSVVYLWYNGKLHQNRDVITREGFEKEVFDQNTIDFQNLWVVMSLTVDAKFETEDESACINYQACKIKGKPIDQQILRFCQSVFDIKSTLKLINIRIAKKINGEEARIPFTGQFKMEAVIVEEESENSHFAVYVKGPFERIWSQCKSILINNEKIEISQEWKSIFEENQKWIQYKNGHNMISYAKKYLPNNLFPRGYHFKFYTFNDAPFNLSDMIFYGMVSLTDLPRENVKEAISQMKSIGVKTVMATTDYTFNSLSTAKLLNIIPNHEITNFEIQQYGQQGDEWLESIKTLDSVMVIGYQFEYFDSEDEFLNYAVPYLLNNGEKKYSFKKLIQKPNLVFSRLQQYQKRRLIEYLKKDEHLVASLCNKFDRYEFQSADVSIVMNDISSNCLKPTADIVLLDSNLSSLNDIIEEGRSVQDNFFKAFTYLISSHATILLSFLSFTIFKIPLPLSSFQYLVISFITDYLPVFLFAQQKPDIDVASRRVQKQKKKNQRLSLKQIVLAFFHVGFFEFCAGLIGFYTTFNYYGFPVKILFGLANAQGYRPPIDNFQKNFNPYTNDYDGYFNSNIYGISADCSANNQLINDQKFNVDWFDKEQSHFDLRKALIQCKLTSTATTNNWVPQQQWSYCDTNKHISPITNQTICYSTEAIYYAQSSFFICIIFFQSTKLFILSTRNSTFLSHQFDINQLMSMILMLIVSIILLYVPGVQDVFGGRPIDFWVFGLPCFSVCVSFTLYEELRKYLIRNTKWFNKYASW